MTDKLSKEIYMWENMIDELDVRALLTWADRAAALEAWEKGLEKALNFIAFTGTDCPAGYERDSFYRGQLHGAIAAAANALAEEVGGDR